MKYAVFASVVTASLAICAFAQTPACPRVQVMSPDMVKPGESLTYVASVTGGDTNVTPTYNWSVSAGSISSGQGTSVIEVDTTGIGGQTVTATVDVGGFDRACSTANSSTTSVAEPVVAQMYDSHMAVNAQERFDNLALVLKASPTDQVYIVTYGGQSSYPGEAAASSKRAKDYLVKQGIDAKRIVTVDGGYRKEAWREIWMVPPGAAPPAATPHLDPSEVTMRKPATPKKPVKKGKS